MVELSILYLKFINFIFMLYYEIIIISNYLVNKVFKWLKCIPIIMAVKIIIRKDT